MEGRLKECEMRQSHAHWEYILIKNVIGKKGRKTQWDHCGWGIALDFASGPDIKWQKKKTVPTLFIIQVIINVTMNCIGPNICKIK